MCSHPGHRFCRRPLSTHAASAAPTGVTRRRLLEGAALATFLGSLGGSAASTLITPSQAQGAPGRILLKNGMILSMDRQVGDLRGDVLIENGRIAQVGPNITVADAQVIDATNRIVMPGFIDTHRHMWEGVIRNSLPNGSLFEYLQVVLGKIGPVYRPEDVYAGNLISAISAMDAGITTILDWSHIQNTPEHTDAAIKGLQESGIRAVFGYGSPQLGWGKKLSDSTAHRYPQDLRRLKTQYFASNDGLVTLALAANGPGFGSVDAAVDEWKLARDVGVRISVHASAGQGGSHPFEMLANRGVFGPDTTYIHCSALTDTEWKMIADTGGTVSLAPVVEMAMGMGVSTQAALAAGLRPSLSIDVETTVPNDLFSQMRAAFTQQRDEIFARVRKGEKELASKRLNARDVLEFATIEGARANGMEARTGSLTPGKQADVILLRTDAINVMPVTDPVAAVVLGMDTSNVDTVIIGGQIKKRDGKLVGIDMARVADLAQKSHDYIVKTSGI